MVGNGLEEFYIRNATICLTAATAKDFKEIIKQSKEDCRIIAKFYDCLDYEALLISILVNQFVNKRMSTNNILSKILKMDDDEMAEMVNALRKLIKDGLLYTKHSNKYGAIYHFTPQLLKETFSKKAMIRFVIAENADKCFVKTAQNQVVRKWRKEKISHELFMAVTTSELSKLIERREKKDKVRRILSHKN